MIEHHILRALTIPAYWVVYSAGIDTKAMREQTPMIHRVYCGIQAWHERYSNGGQGIGKDELIMWLAVSYPARGEKEIAEHCDIIEQMYASDVDSNLMEAYLQQLSNIQIRRELAVSAIDSKIDVDEVIAIAAQLMAKPHAELEPEFVTTNIDELMQLDIDNSGLVWRLDALNKSIGVLRKGMFGVILARVETGKTACWISELTNFLPQLAEDAHAVVFFNEEAGTDVMWRIYSAVCQQPIDMLIKYPVRAKELFSSRGGHKLRFVDKARQTAKGIEATLATLNPAIIIIDSLDKISGFDEDRKDLTLGRIYGWAREIAKTFAPVIGVSQAAAPEGGKHKKWLTELDMSNSKTAKPAELDYLIAIGRIDDAGYEFMRYINIPKNKRRGGVGMDEKLRHGKFTTRIIPDISTYVDATN